MTHKGLLEIGDDCIAVVSDFLSIKDVSKVFFWVDVYRKQQHFVMRGMKDRLMKRLIWKEGQIAHILETLNVVVEVNSIMTAEERRVIDFVEIIGKCKPDDNFERIKQLMNNQKEFIRLHEWKNVVTAANFSFRMGYVLVSKNLNLNFDMEISWREGKLSISNENSFANADRTVRNTQKNIVFKDVSLFKYSIYNDRILSFRHLQPLVYLIIKQEGCAFSIRNVQKSEHFNEVRHRYSEMYSVFYHVLNGRYDVPITITLNDQCNRLQVKTKRSVIFWLSLRSLLKCALLAFGFKLSTRVISAVAKGPQPEVLNRVWTCFLIFWLDGMTLFTGGACITSLFTKELALLSVGTIGTLGFQCAKYGMIQYFGRYPLRESIGVIGKVTMVSYASLTSAFLLISSSLLGLSSSYWLIRSSRWFHKRIAKRTNDGILSRFVKKAFSLFGILHPVEFDSEDECVFN